MSTTNLSASLVVIGAGPGGYPAAFHAADLGMDVVLVDPEANPGGVCLYRGCIPSKALLHAAKVVNEVREGADWGLIAGDVKVDVDKLRAWKAGVVSKLTGGVGLLSKARKVKHIQGMARFVDSKTLAIKTVKGEDQTLTFKNAIIATGSRPAMIPQAIQSNRLMTSTEALDLPDVPARLLVIGGGYIGLELGQVYASLGSKVTVVEMMSSLLPGVDPDLVHHLGQRLKKQFEAIYLDTKVVEMSEVKDGIRVKFDGKAPKEKEQIFDRVLVSVGRKPNSENLGLDKTKVKVGKGGFIEVDPQRRTAEPNIYAIGDVAGQPMLAHKATHEGRVAAHAIAGKKDIFDPRAIPAVVFTDPEVAWCGLMENEAKAQGREVKTSKFPWAASGRAITLGRIDGMTKYVTDPADGRILGVAISGPGAGELIAEATLAIEMGAVAEDIALTIHAHPTLSETLMETAESIMGHSTHFYGKK